MSGNRPKRGLADFLSRELKAPPAPVTEPEVRKSDTSEVREKKSHLSHSEPEIASNETKAHEPAVKAHEPAVVTDRTRVVPASVAVRVAEETSHAPAERAEPPRTMVAEAKTEETNATSDVAEYRSHKAPKSRTSEVREMEPAEKPEPLYLRLTRKDVRFRDEQLGGLHALARRLSKARRGSKGERITDNTLVRVAVDLLLQHADELSGGDEAALLESLRKLCRKRG